MERVSLMVKPAGRHADALLPLCCFFLRRDPMDQCLSMQNQGTTPVSPGSHESSYLWGTTLFGGSPSSFGQIFVITAEQCRWSVNRRHAVVI